MLRLEFGPETLHDLNTAIGREWLDTNGLGSSASGTIVGALTRRYHGLLMCATRPPVGRVHLVAKTCETVHTGSGTIDLDTNLYPNAVHPQGYRHLARVQLHPVPLFVYEAGGIKIEKRIFMPFEHQATVVHYRLVEGPARVQLVVRPMLSGVMFHGLSTENAALNPEPFMLGEGQIAFDPYEEVPAIHTYFDGAFEAGVIWYRNVELPIEEERGLLSRCDLWSPGHYVLPLEKGSSTSLVFSAGRFRKWEAEFSHTHGHAEHAQDMHLPKAIKHRPDGDSLLEHEMARRKKLAGPFAGKGGLLETLAVATNQFVVRREPGYSVIAGYPWFEDWGRDTFISLQGLTLTMDRPKMAEYILSEFARFVQNGLLPNRFPDFAAQPVYNAVDAPLWYVHAAARFLEHTDDLNQMKNTFLPVLEAIVDGYRRGTRYNIRMDEDGLIASGEEGYQLTWMDAKFENWVVTPRRGKPVEIQALWYNALRVLESIYVELGRFPKAREIGALADRAQRSFEQKFWLEDRGYCADVADDPDNGGRADPSLRPNQLFAASLTHPLLGAERTRRMLDVVRAKLLTPRGLRTLAPDDPRYICHYRGELKERDAAYHMGIVWPWLLGAYCDALVNAHSGWTSEVVKEVRSILKGFEEHVWEAGVGSVSEIFESEAPFGAAGCPQQAWSVAELLRIAAECQKHD